MKRIKILFLIFFMAGCFALNAQQSTNGNNGNHNGHINNGNNGHHGGVKAPLDGGLLTVLGAAGIAYYSARKKSKKLES